ncbi:MAG: hypothetical protein K6G11_10635 [Lachnospiraceae bacterium]|nr:hypothetical protein [Lachnospiraceae bacterium]
MAKRQRRYSYSRENEMMEKSVKVSNIQDYTYISGNAVRKVEAIPEPKPEVEVKPRPQKRQQKRLKTVVLGGASYVFIIALMLFVTISIYRFVDKQNQIDDLRSQISALQIENEEAKRIQTDKMSAINDKIDLSQIYNTAVNKYGMVRAENNKIYKYKNQKSDVVRQYSDVSN